MKLFAKNYLAPIALYAAFSAAGKSETPIIENDGFGLEQEVD
jgi:hypothetical protein